MQPMKFITQKSGSQEVLSTRLLLQIRRDYVSLEKEKLDMLY